MPRVFFVGIFAILLAFLLLFSVNFNFLNIANPVYAQTSPPPPDPEECTPNCPYPEENNEIVNITYVEVLPGPGSVTSVLDPNLWQDPNNADCNGGGNWCAPAEPPDPGGTDTDGDGVINPRGTISAVPNPCSIYPGQSNCYYNFLRGVHLDNLAMTQGWCEPRWLRGRSLLGGGPSAKSREADKGGSG